MSTKVNPPSPNQAKILRAMQEETNLMKGLVGRNMGGGHRVPNWQGWFLVDEIVELIELRPWCRSLHVFGIPEMWHPSTIRTHLGVLAEKGWLEHKYEPIGGVRRSLFRVKPDRVRPFFSVPEADA